ncbi:ankyrin repeat family [Micractinium conductrix]|uniref:Ankyrin repeat family n=1 Tax=Micractinium conductrix TaxID=554055 RepID=A0A2P6V7V5_9CHLO|nr:ankyrin repeat family [Micractinium conductrix]|eukprot:PSC70171.1 ankyrin repeat family [Micractinium conductrix]
MAQRMHAQQQQRQQQEQQQQERRQQDQQRQQGGSDDDEEAGSCTCGRCINGVLSPRNAGWIAVAADMERGDLEDLIDDAERSGEFGGAGRREPLSYCSLRGEYSHCGRCLQLLPTSAQRGELCKTFIQGYKEAFETINRVVEDGELPDVDNVLRSWQDGHWSGGNKSRFLSRGGSAEVAISHTLRLARDLAEDGRGEQDEAGEPACDNDDAWDVLSECLLDGSCMDWSDAAYECSDSDGSSAEGEEDGSGEEEDDDI